MDAAESLGVELAGVCGCVGVGVGAGVRVRVGVCHCELKYNSTK